jgi:thioredoxin 1
MHPPVFSDLSFDDAIAKSTEEKKLLLVDATASWCQPCKHMDKTTWVDAKVVAAIGEHVAVQFDVDEEKELAQKLSVRAMPTVIAFRDGKEIDRIVGMRAPAAFVAWVDALERGETSLDAARKTARESPASVEARLGFSRALLQAEVFEEATTEHAWIWEHMTEHVPGFVGVKHSFFARQIAELVAKHPPAREAFARIRDATAAGTLDWFSLNTALGEDAKTLAWFDTVKDRVREDEELAKIVETVIVPQLVAAERWADAGNAYARPLETFEQIVAIRKRVEEMLTKQLPPEQAREALATIATKCEHDIATLRRALREAHRDDDLRAVDEAARAIEPG